MMNMMTMKMKMKEMAMKQTYRQMETWG